MYAKFQLHRPYGFWGEYFWTFFRKFTLYVAMATNQIQRSDKIHMNCRGLLQKHFCKKNLHICSETAKIANFYFSHYKSMETISFHSNHSSYLIWTKNNIICSPCLQMLYVKYGENQLHGFRGDVVWKCWQWWRTDDDACLYYKLSYEPLDQVS